jgi:hypothetical protein
MRIFVNNDSGFEVTITVGLSMDVPNVHTHSSVLAIRRGHKVGIVIAGPVLGVSNDGIIILATTTKVELLKVARLFSETVAVEQLRRNQGKIRSVNGEDSHHGSCCRYRRAG